MCLLSTAFPKCGRCRPKDGVFRDHENLRFSDDDGRHRGSWTPRPWPTRPFEAIRPMVGGKCPTNPREASGSYGNRRFPWWRDASRLEPLDPEAVHETTVDVGEWAAAADSRKCCLFHSFTILRNHILWLERVTLHVRGSLPCSIAVFVVIHAVME